MAIHKRDSERYVLSFVLFPPVAGSNRTYLDPPKGSVSSTIDLFGGMANIRDRASANLYKSQYDFDLDLTHLIGFANDGHLALTPCSFGAMAFLSPLSLVSLSTDGVAIPKLYTLCKY